MFILEIIEFPSMSIENIVFVRCENSFNKFYCDELNLMQFYNLTQPFSMLFYLILLVVDCVVDLQTTLPQNRKPKKF